MRAKPSDNSHAAWWALAILAVPLVYVLSFPPLYQRAVLANGRATWPTTYAIPYRLLQEHTPLKAALVGYNKWWQPITGYDKIYMGFGRRFTL